MTDTTKNSTNLTYNIINNAKTSANGTIFSPVSLTEPAKEISGVNEKTLSITQDNLGTSYYYRESVEYNYVLFNNMCFRIVRIEGDGSVKLIFARDVSEGTTNCNEVGADTGLIKEDVVYGYDNTNSDGYYYADYENNVGGKDRKTITRHIQNIYKDLYVINNKRLEYLEKTVKLIDIAGRIDSELNENGAIEIIKVINNYSSALNLLDDYDHKRIYKPNGTINDDKIGYEDCVEVFKKLKFNSHSYLFALERNKGLKSIIDNIYQTFDEKDNYPTIEEKAANFLYLITKNHTFIDGNKRIAATLFIY